MSDIAVFFFYPRKWKVSEKPFFFVSLFFFSVGKYFSRPLYINLLGHSEVFSGGFSDFFLWLNFIFLGQREEFKGFFVFFTVFFFLGIFSRVVFCCLFSGAIFASRSVFKIFPPVVWNLLEQKIKKNYREDFFIYWVINFQITYPFRYAIVFFYLWNNYPLIHTYPYVPIFQKLSHMMFTYILTFFIIKLYSTLPYPRIFQN